MATKYKISKKNLNEFFSFFGNKKKPSQIQSLIDKDPILQKLDKKIADLNKDASDQMLKKFPDTIATLKKYGFKPE
jgi:hypothetical protein